MPTLAHRPCPQRRLQEIRDHPLARITEAEREDWTGEAEGLHVSLAAEPLSVLRGGAGDMGDGESGRRRPGVGMLRGRMEDGDRVGGAR
ncbi:hypothetical protein [Nonomuraea sp. NPDC049400]|uniref:hypothetical protein n=1 Tax=Nonomuraea sp. NPDC049400 TaxID=3364352 RepID=UPI0037ACDDA1